MRLMFLSPHLDDVSLACGGLISLLGDRATVVTVFTADEPDILSDESRIFLRNCIYSTSKLTSARRKEDESASKHLRCHFIHLGFLDGIYRYNATEVPVYPSRAALFGQVSEQESVLIGEIRKALRRVQKRESFELICLPLAIGGHVDHRICREMANLCDHQRRIVFYQEPTYSPDRKFTFPKGFVPKTVHLSRTLVARKRQSVKLYPSQWKMLELEGADKVLASETYWHLPDSPFCSLCDELIAVARFDQGGRRPAHALERHQRPIP
jgi:LmbE family N-acetylglucosaminyl deacetylase